MKLRSSRKLKKMSLSINFAILTFFKFFFFFFLIFWNILGSVGMIFFLNFLEGTKNCWVSTKKKGRSC